MQKTTNMSDFPAAPRRWKSLAATACILVAGALAWLSATEAAQGESEAEDRPVAGDKIDGKRLIGATALMVETKSGLSFAARVDTGAQGTSMHVAEWEIEGKPEKKARKANIGKRIRFRVENHANDDAWLDGLIIDTVLIKNAESIERRYKVILSLRVGEFEKECIVNLNDRSGMNYPILIGRNFLHGDFLVDVALDENVAAEAVANADDAAASDSTADGETAESRDDEADENE